MLGGVEDDVLHCMLSRYCIKAELSCNYIKAQLSSYNIKAH